MDGAWRMQARGSQKAPNGKWRLWLIMAGRGFGKTRSGAEWVDAYARANVHARIALVGATMRDVREVMIEGESGILNLGSRAKPPIWQPTLNKLIWGETGSIATCYSAAEPEGLRGPQFHAAWADELGRWGLDADGEGALSLSWVRRSRTGFDWRDGVDAPLDAGVEAYRVMLTAGAARLTFDASTPTWAVAAADISLWRAAGATMLTVGVAQIGALALSDPITHDFPL